MSCFLSESLSGLVWEAFSLVWKSLERSVCLVRGSDFPHALSLLAATALWNRLSFGFAHENQGEIWDRVKSAFLQVMDKLLFGLLASSVWQAEPSSFIPVTSRFPKSEIYILKQIYPKNVRLKPLPHNGVRTAQELVKLNLAWTLVAAVIPRVLPINFYGFRNSAFLNCVLLLQEQ